MSSPEYISYALPLEYGKREESVLLFTTDKATMQMQRFLCLQAKQKHISSLKWLYNKRMRKKHRKNCFFQLNMCMFYKHNGDFYETKQPT